MKTITDYADEYVGHPQEIDEDLSVYSKREAYKEGMNKAFELVRKEIEMCKTTGYRYNVRHMEKFINEMQGRKEAKGCILSSITI